MIVADSPARNDYVGDTAVTQFPYSFAITDEEHIEVLLAGVVLVLNSNYTVDGVGEEIGGNVTITPPPGAGVAVTLLRKQPFEQTSVYQNNEDFPAKRLEKDINKLTMMVQQMKEATERSLKFAKKSILTLPELPEGVVGKILEWETTTKLRNVATDVLVPDAVTLPLSIANGGTAATTASAARTSLATGGLADENVFTKRQHWQKGANIASASALAPGTDGNYFHVTGTISITSIGSAVAGSILILEFDDALTVTHHATNLILRGATNMVTVATDILILVSEGTGKWREIARSQTPLSTMLLGHLAGLGLSNNATDPTNDIDVAVGEAVSDDAVITNRVLLNAGAMTKQIDAVWAAGSAAGGRAPADNLTGAKTFHVWIFRRTGGVDDYFFSTSLAPTVPDSGTKKRRIGSLIWDGSTILGFIHDGDNFWLKTPVLDINATNPGTAAVTRVLTSIPTGINVIANMNVELVIVGTAGVVYLSDLGAVDLAASSSVAPLGQINSNVASEQSMGQVRVRTDTAASIRSRLSGSDANTVLRIVTAGWTDRRGRG